MTTRVVIIGAGFAGMYAALAAARVREGVAAGADPLEIVVVAPRPALDLRPRLYEDVPAGMTAPLAPLFEATGIAFQDGRVEGIDNQARVVAVAPTNAPTFELGYDRLVLAAGSQVVSPPLAGLAEHAFSVDQLADADALWHHMQRLGERPPTPGRSTVVVVGGGFTGIEMATEMPRRLRDILGDAGPARVVIVERAGAIGPDLGPGPRAVIEQALHELGIETLLGSEVAAIDAGGVTLADGRRIAAATVIWTAGLRATPLTAQIGGTRDPLGRLYVDRQLRVAEVPYVFAAGDAANAVTDDRGNRTLMSCQHAMPMGRTAGHNAAADLLGAAPVTYEQEQYVTCLDLGDWGAVLTNGWDRAVVGTGPAVKALKRQINQVAIHPPPADRALALAAAKPGLATIA